MSAHLLHGDFFRFLDALAAGEGEAWDLYCKRYLGPNRSVLEAWWEQCLGLPTAAWADRVRRVRVEEYGLLRDIVGATDLRAVAETTLDRCGDILPLSPQPEVYFLVGFFSPDGFTFRPKGEWAVGVGLERLRSSSIIPLLLSHEYAHCYRRRLGHPRCLGERLVAEGFAVALTARAFPERSEAEHLLMRPGQAAVMREYEGQLWRRVRPHIDSDEEIASALFTSGRPQDGGLPSRAGVYLGWRLVAEFMSRRDADFNASAESVVAAAQSALG